MSVRKFYGFYLECPFKDKYSILYNSVPSSSEAMAYLHKKIRHAIETQCDANAESSLHTHSVSTADVIKAVKRLKTDKYNDDGIIMSNNFQPEHPYYLHVLHNCFLLCYITVMHPNYFYVPQ